MNRYVKSSLVIVTLMILSYIVIEDFQIFRKSYSYYTEDDIISAGNFLNLLEDGDIVVPQAWTGTLLLHTGINPKILVHGNELLDKIYLADTFDEFSQILLNTYPNAHEAYVFIISRWSGRENYPHPQLNLLEDFGNRIVIGSIILYKIHLTYSKVELLISPISVEFQAGPQWTSLNLTDFAISDYDILILSLNNNQNTSKIFFARIKDIHGNLTEKTILELHPGSRAYMVNLRNIQGMIDLDNPIELILGFSWFDSYTSIDLEIDKMTLVKFISKNDS